MSLGFLRRGRSNGRSTGSAVVANIVYRRIVDNSSIVSVADACPADVVHRCVVAEAVVSPVSALVACATIAKTVVNAAVESDIRAPVSAIPSISAASPTPITRSPEQTHSGRFDPSARHPEIAVGTVRPVTRRPNITILRTNRLGVRDQHRRSNSDRESELCERDRRYGQHQN